MKNNLIFKVWDLIKLLVMYVMIDYVHVTVFLAGSFLMFIGIYMISLILFYILLGAYLIALSVFIKLNIEV